MDIHASFFFFFLSKIALTCGFLVDAPTPTTQVGGSVITDKHFLTLIELLSDEKQHRYQLEQKVAALEQKVSTAKPDDRVNQLEQYVKQLESKVVILEQTVTTSVNDTCRNEKGVLAGIKNETLAMQNKYSKLEKQHEDLKRSYDNHGNKLTELQAKLDSLLHLQSVNQIQAIQTLQHNVQSLKVQTNKLISNGQARSQDFLALYNKTQKTENKAAELENSQNATTLNLLNQIRNNSRNALINQNNIESRYSQILTKMSKQYLLMNTTTSGILARISDTNKQVAVTACANADNYGNGGVTVVFSDVKMTTGISNVTAFTSSGKFTAEVAGLYSVMVTILTHNAVEAQYGIYKNDQRVVRVRDGSDSDEHSSTAVAAVVLSKGDTVYVKTLTPFVIHVIDSCMTIIQIK